MTKPKAFLSNENILYNYQSGFRANLSTNHCLSFLTDNILEGFNEGLLTGMILIDLQRAFDTIDHKILLQKLQAVRFSKLHTALYPIVLSEYFLLILKVSSQILEKFGYHKGLS